MLALLVVAALGQTPAEFHHVHLNATDPAAAVRFYTSKFDCEAARFGGGDAVWAQKSWLLFQKVKAVADGSDSAVWHIGWGAEEMPSEYNRQLEMGTRFHTPMTDISDLANVKDFFYAYVSGPDGALIELNTARHHQFGHLHLFSADPVAAAQWYAKYLGVKPRLPRTREPRMYRGFQVGPAASFTIGNVNVILFPGEYRGHSRYRSTRGTVFDHIAFSMDRLPHVDGKVLKATYRIKGTAQRAVMVEGPDQVAVEFVEGNAAKP